MGLLTSFQKLCPAMLALLLSACASVPVNHLEQPVRPPDVSARRPPLALVNTALGAVPTEDAFDALLRAAGIEPWSVPRHDPLLTGSASLMQGILLYEPATVRNFGPRLTLAYLMREVEVGRVPVPKAVLLERLARFQRLAVLRPDGRLASALSGYTIQRAGPLVVRNGTVMAGPFELGHFYDWTGGVYRAVNEHLERADEWPLADVYNDADVINRALDGAQEAMLDICVALGRLIVHPIQSLEDLSHLPQGVVALLRDSPEYFERFLLMTRGEQIQAIAKLTTTLVLSTGSASSGTRWLSSAAKGLGPMYAPALSLAADGTFAIGRVAVPVERVAGALSGGPGAVAVLHMANTATQGAEATHGKPWTPPAGGPGKWLEVAESMEEPARRFQSQVSKAPPGWAYRIENVVMEDGTIKPKVDFDGFADNVLLEAKGPNYSHFLKKGAFPEYFQGAKEMLLQAERQLQAARGIPVRWYVAERDVADAIRELLRNNSLGQIEVVFTPPIP